MASAVMEDGGPTTATLLAIVPTITGTASETLSTEEVISKVCNEWCNDGPWRWTMMGTFRSKGAFCLFCISQVTDEYAEKLHFAQSVAVMISVSLLILTIITIWAFKKFRMRFIHETGMSVLYGVITGAIIRYSKSDTHQLEENAVFDPALFFYMLLPPIIFAAGYNVQKKHFFRNITEIIVFAFIGTFISTLFIGFATYFAVWLNIDGLKGVLSLHDCMQFGALISAVDPVTVLAIFSELNADADLYAVVFGESVLNDAVALVMYSTITGFQGTHFGLKAFWIAVLDFVSNFCGSMCIGVFVALLTALITKYSDLRKHAVLETSLVLLMSYTAYIIGEGFGLSGIVAILFCGMGQSHYTARNLSPESREMVHAMIEILNFMSENFIFSYLGISLFTFPNHKWKPTFIVLCIVFIVIGRMLNIYPLSFIMNKTRRWRHIPLNYQTMMTWAGLRGAIAFALAMKNTSTEGKQVITTTTLVIVMFTVWVFGGGTVSMMELLKIPFQNSDKTDDFHKVETNTQGSSAIATSLYRPTDGRIAYWWLRMDRTYLKPVFTKLEEEPARDHNNKYDGARDIIHSDTVELVLRDSSESEESDH